MISDKITSPEEAVALIRSGDTLAITGFATHGCPESLLSALERRFVETAAPRDLTVLFGVAGGDFSQENVGYAHLCHQGLITKAIGAHFSASPGFSRFLVEEEIEAWNLPLGVVSHLFRDMAAGLPGRLSPVGLGTFVDPRVEGGRINAFTKDDIISFHEVAGRELLYYRVPTPSVAFIRGTAADPNGNLILDGETLTLDVLAVAMATKNAGGLVIAQVDYIVDRGTLDARAVKVPGVLVDAVVIAPDGQHPQSLGGSRHNYAFSSQARVPLGRLDPLPLDGRKVIARRAALELAANAVVNLGVGVPEGVAAVANEENVLGYLTLTAEPGVIGGMPVSGRFFGAALNADAVIDMDRQFDFYDGGGLDLAILGLAQCDRRGNVNVSRFGKKLSGAGGFINITQGTKRLIFTGTFMAGAADLVVGDGRLSIRKDGGAQKVLEQVEQVSFSGDQALRDGKQVLYVTERCVFDLTPAGLRLIEIAPGIDLARDILAHMPFEPIMADVGTMDARIFAAEPMGLKERMITLQPADRFVFDSARDTMFMNFEGLRIATPADVAAIAEATETAFAPLGRKVDVVINYDRFTIDDDVVNLYAQAVSRIAERYYRSVARYTTSAFMRMKLGEALRPRSGKLHIYESRQEALHFAGEK